MSDQNKRMVLFVVVALGIWAVFMWLNPPFKPPKKKQDPPPKPNTVVRDTLDKGCEGTSLFWLSARLDPGRLYPLPPLPRPGEIAARLEEVKKARAVLARPETAYPLIGFASPPFAFPGQFYYPPPPPDELLKKLEEHHRAQRVDKSDEGFTLGDADKYKLHVRVSRNEAAIREIVLNRYDTATRSDARWEAERLKLVSDNNSPRQQSFRLEVDGEPDLRWELQPGQTAEKAVFRARLTKAAVVITKTFTLKPGQYHIDMVLEFSNEGETPAKVSYTLSGPYNLPLEGETWAQQPIRKLVVGAVESESKRDVHLIYPVLNTGHIRQKHDRTLELGNADPPDQPDKLPAVDMQYAGARTSYFAALAVVNGEAIERKYIKAIRTVYNRNIAPDSKDLMGDLSMISRPIPLGNGQAVKHEYLLYAGPAKVRLLGYEDGVDEELAERYEKELHMRLLTDAPDRTWWGGRFSAWLGWTSLLVFFTNLMHGLLEFFYSGVGHYGLAIIMLTVLVRLLMFPVSRKQILMSQNMQEKMAVLRPELARIAEQHKNDPQARMQAQMEAYRRHGLNPLAGCFGCLVVLLQMPVFMGLYYALSESVNLRLASLLWIENMAAPDMLIWWGNNWLANNFLIHLGPYLNILPILAIIMMFLHQKMVAPPAMDDQQAMQMKMMNIMMIFFAYMFYWVAAGLCLYFTMSSAWGLVERRFMPKPKHAQANATPTGPSPTGSSTPDRGRQKPSAKDRDKDRNGAPGWRKRLREWWERLLKKAEKK